jgi:peptidoglycan L-alanyl-D-glutamate endopeptidase CwlK
MNEVCAHFEAVQGGPLMTFRFSQRSRNNLEGVHPDLVRVVERALELTRVDFVVIEGLRTKERQRKLFAARATRTMNSRHLTGHAVDLVPWIDGTIRWDWPPFYKIAEAMKEAAEELGVGVRWGGSWKILNGGPIPNADTLSHSFPDGPHFELPAR